MTRKSVKFPSGLRRGLWKTNFLRRENDDKSFGSRILISAAYSKRWSNLKSKFCFKSDAELVDYLLTLGEAQPKPSISSDHNSEEPWFISSSNKKKKRGPSLRAVLRRSTRNSCVKSGYVSESIESEEIQTEDSCMSIEDAQQRSKLLECKVKCDEETYCKANPSKKRQNLLSSTSGEKNSKVDQLNEELALIVESVSLKPQETTENELYEFKDDPQSENGSSSQLTLSGQNKVGKGTKKRWKSYHKDKRKWRQSYAAVLHEDNGEELQSSDAKSKCDESSSYKSEKEKRVIKPPKKNRILTAYLDSQNKITGSSSREPTCLGKEDVELSVKDSGEKCEGDVALTGYKKSEKDEPDSSKSNDDDVGPQLFDKGDISGKENQSKLAPNEPVFIEVGERVKLKKRKRKTFQDSEETASKLKDEDALCEINASDLQKHNWKQKQNWKKSIIDYELEEMELDPKRNTFSSSLSPNSSSKTFEPQSNNAEKDQHSKIESPCRSSAEEVPQYMKADVQENDQENSLGKPKTCTECNLKHVQLPCPVQNPLYVVEDLINFEQWQSQCKVQVRCSVIEAPRPKPNRLRRSTVGSTSPLEGETNYRDSSDAKNDRLYAEESLPTGLGLQVINEEHGRSVVAKANFAQYTKFGPLVGTQIHEKDISDESDMRHIWEVLDGKNSIYLNTEDPQKSNWLRFMRPAPEREDHNMTLIVQNRQLYFVSVSEISKGSELLYWADDHITSWSKKKNLKSSCGGCNMRFAHPLYYRTHCAIFHDPSHSLTIRKYHCKVCGEAVMGKENIMKHAADLHEGRGAYQCQYCHKFFLRLNYLEMHRTYGCSSNPHRTRPLCDFCGRYFCQPQKLKVHIKRMHSDINEVLKEFQCKSCLKILGSRAALQRHFKEVHHRDVVVTSNCDRCGKSFQNRSNLKIHMLTHSGVKPFRCQQDGCSAAFTTKQCLQFHYKKAHGLSEESLPRIERSIAYTFDAYAGENVNGKDQYNDHAKKPPRVTRKGRKSSNKMQKNVSNSVQTQPVNQDVTSEPLHHMPVENDALESSVLVGCSASLQANNVVEGPSGYKDMTDDQVASEAPLPQKFDTNSSLGSSLTSRVMHLPYDQEEKQLSSNKTLTQLRTVTSLHHSDEAYHSQHISSMMSSHSQIQSPQSPPSASSNQGLRSMVGIESKGHKKWLGEVIEVAEEAAAAAMQLSPCLSPHLKRDLYDFDENKVKGKMPYMENSFIRQDVQVEVVGRCKPASALAPFYHPESASMLVEAALDAAERDICCPPIPTKAPPDLSDCSPEPSHLSHPSYSVGSPANNNLPNPSYYSTDNASSVSSADPSSSHYPLIHSPRNHPHILPMDTYSIPTSHVGQRIYNIQAHQGPHHQLLTQGPSSSDDEACLDSDRNPSAECAQNLSLNEKQKLSVRSDISSMYGVPMQHCSSAYQDHISPSHQNDPNFSGAMVATSPRYQLYDLSQDRQRSNVSVPDLTTTNPEYNSYEELTGSVDLSLPRSHLSPDLHSNESHATLVSSPQNYTSSSLSPEQGHPGPAHVYASSSCLPPYSSHPAAYQNLPVQRALISSSSNGSSVSPSVGTTHYQSYSSYY